jgi:hypothetical protein
VIQPGKVTTNDRPIATFQTTDATSGIDHYEIKVESLTDNTSTGFFTEQQSPYMLPQLTLGKHRVTVRAYDLAGNITEGSAEVELVGLNSIAGRTGRNGYIMYGGIGALLMLLLLIILLLLRRRHRIHTVYQLEPLAPTNVSGALPAHLPSQMPADAETTQAPPLPTPTTYVPVMQHQPQEHYDSTPSS